MSDRERACILCGGADFVLVAAQCRDSASHAVMECRSCRLLQLSPMPNETAQDQFHARDLQSKPIFDTCNLDVVVARKAADTARRVAFMRDHVRPNGSVLDVGSGYGVLLGDLAKEGYRVTGVELSEERRSMSRQVCDAPVIGASLFELPDDLGTFDAVLLTHVLEHLVRPVAALDALRRFVASGGCLIVEVPNAEDLLLEASEPYRAFYWQLAHVSYFSRKTLQTALGAAGFSDVRVVGVQRYGVENLMSWLTTGQPQLPIASFHTTGPYRWLEDIYKQQLEQSLRCDTLVAVARIQ